MLFIIYCMDKPGSAQTRAANMQAHRDYLATGPIKIVLSGPLTTDDGQSVIGSFFMVEAADRGEIEKFQRNDPLFSSGLWASVDVRAFAKRIDNR
ncbi:MAG: YciI family protein [Burkholderiales bacterium]